MAQHTAKISELDPVSSLTGDEMIEVVQSGVSKRTTAAGITDSTEVATVTDKGTISSGTVTFNRTTGGPKQKLTVGGALTVAFTGWAATGIYSEIEIELVNGGLGVTWPTVNWLAGNGTSSTSFSSMSVTLSSSGTNFAVVWSSDGGSTLYGRAI